MAQQVLGDDGQLDSETGSAYAGEGMISLYPDWFEANAVKTPAAVYSAVKQTSAGGNEGESGSTNQFPAPGIPNPNGYPAPNLPSYGPAPTVPSLGPAPDPLAPWTETFNAPKPEDVLNDPVFQSALQQGLKQIQRSAAAKGTLLTGGTLKGLQDYGQTSANSQYENVYNRDFNAYDTRRQNFLTNESNRFQSQKQNSLDTWNQQLDLYNMNRLNRNDTFGMDQSIFGDASALRGQNWNMATDYFNMGQANRMNDFNIFSTADMNDFTKQYDLAQLGRPQAPTL